MPPTAVALKSGARSPIFSPCSCSAKVSRLMALSNPLHTLLRRSEFWSQYLSHFPARRPYGVGTGLILSVGGASSCTLRRTETTFLMMLSKFSSSSDSGTVPQLVPLVLLSGLLDHRPSYPRAPWKFLFPSVLCEELPHRYSPQITNKPFPILRYKQRRSSSLSQKMSRR